MCHQGSIAVVIPYNPEISYFAQVDFRNDNRFFGLKQSDRMMGVYIIGKTSTGKSNAIQTLIRQDINFSRGHCLLDVHGDLIREVIEYIPTHRKNDVVYVDTTRPDSLDWGYNPLKKVDQQYRHLVVSHILETFQKIWGQQSWGIRIEYILRHTLNLLLKQEQATFADIPRVLTDESYRVKCLEKELNDEEENFWYFQFPKYTRTDILPILNKVGSFLAIPTIRKILVENQKQISVHAIINEQKLLMVNLSKGVLGVDGVHLLGSLLISAISSAGFYRATIAESERKPFYIYLDEFHNFSTLALVNMFSELRKYRIAFVIAHQYLGQISPAIRDAVLGNIGSMLVFRISYADAKFFSQEFFPVFRPEDFVNLPNYCLYSKILIDKKPSKAFSAKTFPASGIRVPNRRTGN